MSRHLGWVAFVSGLGVIAWIGFGYLGSHALALTMTLLIGAFYLTGAVELQRFQRSTASLRAALTRLSGAAPQLGDWLSSLPASLQNPVRLRIEGERAGLPGPALTPYLVGLLVLLGMLGTFLGMVVTLNGAVMALESTTDLATIRAALAAPIKGLGLAFGTSVAGVAASAMLGLMSVLARRERLQVGQILDASIASTLRGYSRAHQREQTLEHLQLQARAVPALVDTLQTMMARLEQHHEGLSQRLLDGQERFYQHAQIAYVDLASSVDRSLKDSLSESARLAGAAIQPVVEATMAAILRETGVFQSSMADTVGQQLDGIATRFEATAVAVAQGWTGAVEQHARHTETLVADVRQSLSDFTTRFAERADALLVSVDARHAASERDRATALAQMARQTTELHDTMAVTSRDQLQLVAQQFGATTTAVAQTWRDALTEQRDNTNQLSSAMQSAMASLVADVDARTTTLLDAVDRAHATSQSALASSDRQRLDAWTGSLEKVAASVHQQSEQAGVLALAQQKLICQTLEQTARDIQAQAQTHAHGTIGEMARLITTASEAPRAAAEVISALRAQLSESLVRDNSLLEERSRIMETLSTLLDAVNRSATEQHSAIDTLVTASATMLTQLGAQFAAQVAQESGKMEAVATQVTVSSVEMASMGEAFAAAVQLFGQSSEALTDQLQRIETALNASTTRSDEQLAYYVAQAREIVDLSISSQKQIVDDLQQLAIRQSPQASEAA